MSLGNMILELRKKKGLSQEQLGEKVNVTRQTISNWELNETTPNPEQLKLLSKVLEVSIDELLGNDFTSIIETKMNKIDGNVIKNNNLLKVMFVIIVVIVAITISFILAKYLF